DHDLNNLIGQYYQPRLIAKNGEHGMGKGMDGHAGADLIIKVPCGTLVWRIKDTTPPIEKKMARPDDEDEEVDEGKTKNPIFSSSTGKRPLIRSSSGGPVLEIDLSKEDEGTAEAEDNEAKGELVADLTENGQQFVLSKGGRGGLGNRNFATARHQTPRFAQPGEPGTEGEFLLELRIMAEVGLVGYPNAGKSTLLTAISKARPKVAPYPFTTLHPQIGIVEYEDWHRLTVCDVPGLIEGAHNNVGLGHEFLRHIQRCKILVLLLDMAGTDGRKPWDDYKQLLKELELYDPALLDKPRLVVANKMDEAVAEKNLKQFKTKIKKVSLLPISAAFDQGMEKFRKTIRKEVEEATEG
ncbi:MAG TPA: GTPase ObgE, partial [Candidatus Baltobacteraceae bacterium]|nr:GTPase ObgE [Candidatus Baltobacteraceae bacterium]